jgi:hypothetical protein
LLVETLKGSPIELNIRHESDSVIVELLLQSSDRMIWCIFTSPSSLEPFVDIFNGFDFIKIFDKNKENKRFIQFGRYRVEYFIDDPFSFTVDYYELLEK